MKRKQSLSARAQLHWQLVNMPNRVSAAVERVREKAGRKGVEVLPPWLEFVEDGWWCDRRTGLSEHIADNAAALIVTGALAKWLAGQGIAVAFVPGDSEVGPNPAWYRMTADMGIGFDQLDATDHLSALLAATLARLDELPDSPPPASKEGE